MSASNDCDHDPGPSDADLRALAAALLKAIAAEPVPEGIAEAARQLQQALAGQSKARPGAAEDTDLPLT